MISPPSPSPRSAFIGTCLSADDRQRRMTQRRADREIALMRAIADRLRDEIDR
jgi:hypothetical protein